MNLEIEGKVHKILPLVTGNGKNGSWQKQEFVIEIEGTYPKKVCFSVWGDKTSMLENLKTNQEVTVAFNAESREFKERWYTDLRAWKITPKAAQNNTNSAEVENMVEGMTFTDDEGDMNDLPF